MVLAHSKNKKAPTGVWVIGIVDIVLAVMGIIGFFMSIIMIRYMASAEMYIDPLVSQSMEGWRFKLGIVSLVAYAILTIFTVSGLFGRKNWARWLKGILVAWAVIGGVYGVIRAYPIAGLTTLFSMGIRSAYELWAIYYLVYNKEAKEFFAQ